jgi:hypothetical protein
MTGWNAGWAGLTLIRPRVSYVFSRQGVPARSLQPAANSLCKLAGWPAGLLDSLGLPPGTLTSNQQPPLLAESL